jgi:hypothetical protein
MLKNIEELLKIIIAHDFAKRERRCIKRMIN